MFYLGVTASICIRASIISRTEGSSPGFGQLPIYFKDVPLAVIDTNISSFIKGQLLEVPKLLLQPKLAIQQLVKDVFMEYQ